MSEQIELEHRKMTESQFSPKTKKVFSGEYEQGHMMASQIIENHDINVWSLRGTS